MYAFFFYGTLRDDDLRRIVLGRSAVPSRMVPATLPGYRRIRLVERSYPALIADPRSAADGCLVGGLDEATAARVSYYESDDYDATEVRVETADGVEPAWVFLPGRAMRMTPAPWDIELWRRRFKPRACAGARAWMGNLERPEMTRLAADWRARRRLPGIARD